MYENQVNLLSLIYSYLVNFSSAGLFMDKKKIFLANINSKFPDSWTKKYELSDTPISNDKFTLLYVKITFHLDLGYTTCRFTRS